MIKANLDDVLMILGHWKPTTNNNRTGRSRYVACCPIHEDEEPSMVVEDKGDGKVLFHCYVGCDYKDIEEEVKRRLPSQGVK